MLTLVSKFDPVLRQKARPVEFPGSMAGHLPVLLREMTETMKQESGLGLAAPQVGLDWQVAVVQLPKHERIELVNPVLLKASRKVIVMEGCLSLPGEEYHVPRSMEILVGYQDRHGKNRVEKFRGLEAQAVQHELDHLAGKLIDEFSREQRDHEPKPQETPVRVPREQPQREVVETDVQPGVPAGEQAADYPGPGALVPGRSGGKQV
jgi:peptide deformylase